MIVYTRLKNFSALLFLFAFGFGWGLSHADEKTDSIQFQQKRIKILSNHPSERLTLILGAAEELAREGFYAEANELLFDLEDPAANLKFQESFLSDTGVSEEVDSELKAEAHGGKKIEPGIVATTNVKSRNNFNGYVQGSTDYDQYTGQSQPWSGRIRSKLEWVPTEKNVDRITTFFQGSDRNASFDLWSKGSAFHRIFKMEGEALVEKKINQSYGDSLDRGYAWLQIEGNTRPLGKAISLALPLRISAEQFRFDRFGYLSSQSIFAGPGVEAVSEDLRKSVNISWEIQNNIYPRSRETGNLRQGPVAWGEWYGDRISIEAETRFQTYGYVRDTSLIKRKNLESRASAFVRTWPWLKVGFRTLGETESSDYLDSIDFKYRDSIVDTITYRLQEKYQLKGANWNIEPQLVGEWASIYSATLGLAYSRGEYPVLSSLDGQNLVVQKYIDEPYADWRPSLSFTVLAKSIFLNLAIDYETNTGSTASTFYSVGSSRGWGFNGIMNWKIRPWLELDFSGMVERELSAGTVPGRIQNLTSLSLGFTSRFP